MRHLKKKKFFKTGIAFALLTVAIMVSSATAVPVLNNVSDNLVAEDSVGGSIEVNDELNVDLDTHFRKQPELNDDPVNDEEPAGIFLSVLIVNVYRLEDTGYFKVRQPTLDYEVRLYDQKTKDSCTRPVFGFLRTRTIFFGLEFGRKYTLSCIPKSSSGETKNITISQPLTMTDLRAC